MQYDGDQGAQSPAVRVFADHDKVFSSALRERRRT
ncbi:predicted protein [Streptomyces iranensis]|uniref:Uncharacterized protein n=1 Tax=Streptomyces iranensis TaxID=576784 RepID=A0A060ZKY1_9ACTN|nr:predicted protein [Streptomyces iranensis]